MDQSVLCVLIKNILEIRFENALYRHLSATNFQLEKLTWAIFYFSVIMNENPQ